MKLEPEFYGSPRWSWEILDCAMPMTFDTYSNCAHQCVYCFAYFQRAVNWGTSDAYLAHKVKAVDVEKVKRLFRLDQTLLNTPSYKQFGWYIRSRMVLQWGGLSDGFDWYEKKFRKSLELLKFFREIDYPISISTKATWFLDDPEYQDVLRGAKNVHVKYSIITPDAQAAKHLEAGCPSPDERFEALRKLNDLGIGATTLRFRPFVIGVSDRNLEAMFQRAHDAGCYSVTTEFLCIEKRATENHKERYRRISEQCGFDIWDFYRTHSYSGSGLMRLNYDIKRPYIAQMEELSARYGMPFFVSDAHHKEASAGAGCCGLPSEGPLSNYNRGQFAEAILIAKRTGQVKWADIAVQAEGLKEIPYIGAVGYNQGDTANRAKNRYHSMFDYMHDMWNNTKSWSSPARYFGGALVPGGLDEAGDVIYLYNKPFVETGRRVSSVAELVTMVDAQQSRKDDGADLGHVAFPIFVLSKERANTATTPGLLSAARLNYTLVLDPGEVEAYQRNFSTADYLPVPSDHFGLVRSRQFVLDYARSEGMGFYWLLDDDIKNFYEYTTPGSPDRRLVNARAALSALEALMSDYQNVAIGALDWQQFAWRSFAKRPFTVNTRAYLAALIRADTGLNYDTRFEVKSDVAFLLSHLSAGWQTILMHRFAFDTPEMASFKGGCYPSYQSGLQNAEARLFQNSYPDICSIVDKGAKGLDARFAWRKFPSMLQPHVGA